MAKIMLDPGHGGEFFGAVVPRYDLPTGCVELCEKDLNLKACTMLMGKLAVHDVTMTRYSDRSLGQYGNVDSDLAARCILEHREAPDCFVSIHCNASTSPSAHGFEVWTTPGETSADSLAEYIYQSVNATGTAKMRQDTADGDNDREGHLYVLMNTRSPAVLVELGFMTHDAELQELCYDNLLRLRVEAVAEGIDAWCREVVG